MGNWVVMLLGGIMCSERVECIGDCRFVFAGLCVHRKGREELIQLRVDIVADSL